MKVEFKVNEAKPDSALMTPWELRAATEPAGTAIVSLMQLHGIKSLTATTVQCGIKSVTTKQFVPMAGTRPGALATIQGAAAGLLCEYMQFWGITGITMDPSPADVETMQAVWDKLEARGKENAANAKPKLASNDDPDPRPIEDLTK